MKPSLFRHLCLLLLLAAPFKQIAAQAPYTPAYYEAEQTHGAVHVTSLGEGLHRIYVFTPAEPVLSPGPAPIVFFHHGWQGMNPLNYGAQIDHLTRSGYIVLYPVYQDADSTNPQTVEANAAQAEVQALAYLRQTFELTPDLKQVLYYGYSMGAAISLRLALDHEKLHLPEPQALLLAAPGDAHHVARGPNARTLIGDVAALPAALPVAIVTGVDDVAIGLPTARALFAQLCSPARVLLLLPTATNGPTTMHAGHASPGAPDSRYNFPLASPPVDRQIPGRAGFEPSASLNQLDFGGYWKLTDSLLLGMATGHLPPPLFNDPMGLKQLGQWTNGTEFPAASLEICRETLR